MSSAVPGNNNTASTTIHGVMILVASVIGVIGYLIRARLNDKARKLAEKDRQDEERRRAALAHVIDQGKLFIGPLKTLHEERSGFVRLSPVITSKSPFFGELYKDYYKQDNRDYLFMMNKKWKEAFVKDENGFRNVYVQGFLSNNLLMPVLKKQIELIEKFAYTYAEIPSREEFLEMYPNSKFADEPLSLLSSYCAYLRYYVKMFELYEAGVITPDNLFDETKWWGDIKGACWKMPYITPLLDWMYRELLKKKQILFKQDMKLVTTLSVAEMRMKRTTSSYVINTSTA